MLIVDAVESLMKDTTRMPRRLRASHDEAALLVIERHVAWLVPRE